MKNDHDLINNHKRFVFLDDMRNPKDCFFYINDPIYINEEWIIVRNYDQFIKDILENGISYFYSMDHDLADIHYEHKEGEEIDYSKYTEKTGYECAKWLVDYCMDKNIPFPDYRVHSMNGVGRRNIMYYVENYKRYRLRID